MRQGRVAVHSPASSSTPAEMPPERLPRPRPGPGTRAEGPRPPGGVLLPARVQSRRLPSLQANSRVERRQRTYFEGTRVAHEISGNLQCVYQGFAIDQVEAEELFLGLGEGAIEHERLTAGPDRH